MQLDQHQKRLRDLVGLADRFLLSAWVAHLDTCTPPPTRTLVEEVATHDPLDLPPALADGIRARADAVLAERPSGIGHRDLLARLEADLGIDVTVTAGRSETTRATVESRDGALDPVTHEALVRYHEQVASVDRRRTRDSEEREVAGLDAAVTALRTAIARQVQGVRSALQRAETERNRLRREYESAYDEVHATDSNLRNIQRASSTKSEACSPACRNGSTRSATATAATAVNLPSRSCPQASTYHPRPARRARRGS